MELKYRSFTRIEKYNENFILGILYTSVRLNYLVLISTN